MSRIYLDPNSRRSMPMNTINTLPMVPMNKSALQCSQCINEQTKYVKSNTCEECLSEADTDFLVYCPVCKS